MDDLMKRLDEAIRLYREAGVSGEAGLSIMEDVKARVRSLEEALKPFDSVAGLLFSRNYNNGDIVFDGGIHRSDCLFAEDFFAVRAALSTREEGSE